MRPSNSWIFRRVALAIVLLASSGSANFLRAADIIVGVNIGPAQRVPLSSIDHSPWTTLLKRYVDERGLVAYSKWLTSRDDVLALDDYLAHLSTTDLSGNQQELLAFWINAYNAVTVKGILREYPTSSIRNHTARFFGYNIWKNLKLIVAGKEYSLDEMEHDILRKMSEPRIHFAIVCASIGCPRLLNEAYQPARVEEQLTLNAKVFFADQQNFRYDISRNSMAMSPILQWFESDFGDNQVAQLRRIAPWLPDAPSRQLALSGTATVSFLDYDWGLNERK